MASTGGRLSRVAKREVSYVEGCDEDGNEKKEGKKKKEKTDSTQKSNQKVTELSTAGVVLTESEKKATKKLLRTVLLTLEKMLPFEKELLRYGGFGKKQWRMLYAQIKNDKENFNANALKYVHHLFISDAKGKCPLWEWRNRFRNTARDIVSPLRNGQLSYKAARTSLEVGKTASFTPTFRFVDGDDEANDAATGNFVSTLEEFRKGNNIAFTPPFDVASCFAKGDRDKARVLARRDYNSVMAKAAEKYDYKTAVEMAAYVIKQNGLSSSFPTFTEESYETPPSFPSAEDVEELCNLSQKELHLKVEAFLDEKTDLVKDSREYKMAFHMRDISILKVGSIMDDVEQKLYDGHGGVAPLEGGGHAFFTVGTPTMLKEGQISRSICPGMSNRHYGDRSNNEHPIVFNPDLLVSPTHSIAFDTRAHGQNNNAVDDTYGGRTMAIGGVDRIFRRLHENQKCSKPCDKYTRSELVRYQLELSGHGTITQHRFNLIYATACGIGTKSFEPIIAELRSKATVSSMAETCVNPEDQCDGDHCFHRLMSISNSIYFCFPVDHSTNRCCSNHRANANDWNYTLAVREYVNGN